MEATPPGSLSGAAILASLAYLTLPHLQSDIPGHPGPISLKLQTFGHPPRSGMCLLMGVLYQLLVKSEQTTLSHS